MDILLDNENEIPYNTQNKFIISKEIVEKILNTYNVQYTVKNISIFKTSFTHKSYLKRNCWTKEQLSEKKNTIGEYVYELQDKSYEDLEFFGDSLLDFIVVIYITTRYEGQNEGFYTKLKSKIVSGASLSRIAKKLNFHKYIVISKSIEDKGGRYSDKILEDVFEAFLGALHKDGITNTLDNFTICYNFIFNLLDNTNDDFDYPSLLLFDNNYKDQLLKYYHQNKWGTPKYVDVKIEENNNNKIFSIGVINPTYHEYSDSDLKKLGEKKFIMVSVGSTKKKAEQQVSKEILRIFGVLMEDNFD